MLNNKTIKKILIIGPAWVGDMVMAQTLFKLLKQQHPEATIDVLAPAWTRPLMERMPEITKALDFPLGHRQLQLRKRYQLGKCLRKHAYDWAIVLPGSFKSALVPFWAKIPLRTGWLREQRFGLLNDWRRLDKQKYPLMIQRFLALALPKGAELPSSPALPRLNILAADVKATLAKHSISKPGQPLLVLCPGAEFGPAKRWPSKHYAAVARDKLAQGWSVWLLGSKKDQIVTAEINGLTENRCIDFAGTTSLTEAVDLLSLATVVVTNDSGLMHIAAALGRAIVVMYGSSSPQFTPPLSNRVQTLSLNLECSPCFKRECPLGHLKCLQDLAPVRVLKAIKELLKEEVSE
jgi:heptosyltransferase-2